MTFVVMEDVTFIKIKVHRNSYISSTISISPPKINVSQNFAFYLPDKTRMVIKSSSNLESTREGYNRGATVRHLGILEPHKSFINSMDIRAKSVDQFFLYNILPVSFLHKVV